MNDPKQLIASINTYLAGAESVNVAALARLAAEYAELCQQTNQRLQRCDDLIEHGLYSEAVDYAECQPRLLELASSPAIADQETWDRECDRHSMPRSPRLQIKVVERLKQASSDLEPLRPMLAKNRLLALCNAPLQERMANLRALSAADPKNGIWELDLQAFEEARLQDMKAEASSAIATNDALAIMRLADEAADGSWRQSPPASLRESLAGAAAAIRQHMAVDQLTALAPSVRQALADQNEEAGRRVFAEWGRIVTESMIHVPPELLQEIIPLSRWIDSLDEQHQAERQFIAACHELRSAVDQRLAGPTLRAAYHKAAAFNIELPNELYADYMKLARELKRHDEQDKRRQLVTALLLGGSVAIAIGAMVYVMFFYGKK